MPRVEPAFSVMMRAECAEASSASLRLFVRQSLWGFRPAVTISLGRTVAATMPTPGRRLGVARAVRAAPKAVVRQVPRPVAGLVRAGSPVVALVAGVAMAVAAAAGLAAPAAPAVGRRAPVARRKVGRAETPAATMVGAAAIRPTNSRFA